jgi:hypothetical protein
MHSSISCLELRGGELTSADVRIKDVDWQHLLERRSGRHTGMVVEAKVMLEPQNRQFFRIGASIRTAGAGCPCARTRKRPHQSLLSSQFVILRRTRCHNLVTLEQKFRGVRGPYNSPALWIRFGTPLRANQLRSQRVASQLRGSTERCL